LKVKIAFYSCFEKPAASFVADVRVDSGLEIMGEPEIIPVTTL
jgi:hypothetical protein